MAPDTTQPQDGADRGPGLGLRGHTQFKAVQGISTDHLSHLAALLVTPKWLQTLPSPKMGLLGIHGLGQRVMDQPKLSGGGGLPFEPSSSHLGHFQVAPDPPFPQDGAARQPWSESKGHGPTKAVQGMSIYHLSHLAVL